MTKPAKATEQGLEPHYKIRVVIPGTLLHLASRDKPHRQADGSWTADWIDDPDYGDSAGYIDWAEVCAITWRWSA